MKGYHIITATIFTIIALLHLIRAFAGWPAQIGGLSIPMWVSGLAFLIAGILAAWGWRLFAKGAENQNVILKEQSD